jgi:hypothetical protein
MSEDETRVQYPPPEGQPTQPEATPPSGPSQPQAMPPPAQPAQPPPQYTPPPPYTQPPPQYAPPAAAAPPQYAPAPSLVDRAKAGDSEALATMFGQFVPRGEQILEGHYLGLLGIFGLGTHSFAAVTPRRFATLRISMFGGVEYRDGSLEYVNSAAVLQPSKVKLYVWVAALSLFFFLVGVATLAGGSALGIVFLLLSVAHIPLTVRIYYARNKSGIVLSIREGLAVYAFIDRSRMRLANQLYRRCTDVRDERLRELGHP